MRTTGPRPRIGVPAQPLVEGRVKHWTSRAFGVPSPYVESLRRAGALPVLLAAPDDAPDEALDLVDGLLLMGGGDVEPSRYGGDGRGEPTLYGVEPDRDELELALVRLAAERQIPILAICRGIQVLNVAFGGTLHLHLPAVDGMDPHGPPLGDEPILHEVTLESGSRVAKAAGAEVMTCASHHHQGIERLGDRLAASGRSGDGLVEAVEADDGWILGVQWHPEETAAGDPAQQGLFDELVRRAGERRG